MKLFNCEYLSLKNNQAYKFLKELSENVFIASKNNKKEVYPLLIGSMALSEYYENIGINDCDMIMTPLQTFKFLKGNSDNIQVFVLDVNGIKHHKLLFENNDITIITDKNQAYYKLVLYSQGMRTKKINGQKIIIGSQKILKMLKTVHLFYNSSFEKHIKHYDLMFNINYKKDSELMAIREDMIKEAKCIRDPVNKFEKSDQFTFSTISTPSSELQYSVENYKKVLTEYCNSEYGEQFWDKYTCLLNNFSKYSKYVSPNELYPKYFYPNELEKAKYDSERITIDQDNVISIILDDQVYKLHYSYDIKSNELFNISIFYNDIWNKILRIINPEILYQEYYSSSEMKQILRHTIYKYKLPDGLTYDTIKYLLRLASPFIKINLTSAYKFSLNNKNHQIVSIYEGKYLDDNKIIQTLPENEDSVLTFESGN
uniref:Uncharacterized protein n=1 Tax=viral metagenome TaxID=1070528 RepID=A0A6C0AGN7_9ZZZZ